MPQKPTRRDGLWFSFQIFSRRQFSFIIMDSSFLTPYMCGQIYLGIPAGGAEWKGEVKK